MKPPAHQLQQNQEQTVSQEKATTNQSALEFATAEESIRHDAGQTPLPPAIVERLRKSIEQEPPKPAGSWWRRFLGK